MFQFKKFNVEQEKTAMKVGTDGVLLGAWCPINHNPKAILDIGTGTGLIALILAQRTDAEQIDAIEIEENAYEEATENFENSNWSDRLFCYHTGLDELMDDPEDEYDIIVSNPPFYSENYKPKDENRDIARFQDALPFELLIDAADLLLAENGVFAVIIPFKEEARFIEMAKNVNLFPLKITRVKGTPKTEIKRSLLAFGRNIAEKTIETELVIENSRHNYTLEYIDLVKNFYLKM